MLKRNTLLIGLSTLGLFGCPSDDTMEGEGEGSSGTEGATETSDPETSAGPGGTGETETGEETGTGTETGADGSSTETADESGSSSSGEPQCEAPTQIELTSETFFPEGIASDAAGNLYVGSLVDQEVVRIRICAEDTDLEVEPFIEDEELVNVVGLFVDETNQLLWLCNSNGFEPTAASIRGYGLDDGMLEYTHPWPEGEAFCNDLVMDGSGNLYATDSVNHNVVRVSADDLLTDEAPVEVWSEDNDYFPEQGGWPEVVSVNGITWDGGDNLYVAKSDSGQLFRVPIPGNSNLPVPVGLGDATLPGPDGIEWLGNDTILVVGDGALRTVTLAAEGPAAVADLETGIETPTTAVVIDPYIWVVESQIDHLQAPEEAEPPFIIGRFDLPAGE